MAAPGGGGGGDGGGDGDGDGGIPPYVPLANALLFPHRSTQRSHRAATLLIPVHPREVSIPPRHPLQSHLLVLVLVTLTDLPSALTGKATKLLARLNR